MREIKRIINHCSATKPWWMSDRTLSDQRNEIRRWHVQDNGWSDIGYHLLIGRRGDTARGRPISRPGAHTRGHNRDTLAICLIGGHGSSADDPFLANFTEAQARTLRNLLKHYKKQLKIPNKRIYGHNDFAPKACPGFNVDFFVKTYLQMC